MKFLSFDNFNRRCEDFFYFIFYYLRKFSLRTEQTRQSIRWIYFFGQYGKKVFLWPWVRWSFIPYVFVGGYFCVFQFLCGFFVQFFLCVSFFVYTCEYMCLCVCGSGLRGRPSPPLHQCSHTVNHRHFSTQTSRGSIRMFFLKLFDWSFIWR